MMHTFFLKEDNHFIPYTLSGLLHLMLSYTFDLVSSQSKQKQLYKETQIDSL